MTAWMTLEFWWTPHVWWPCGSNHDQEKGGSQGIKHQLPARMSLSSSFPPDICSLSLQLIMGSTQILEQLPLGVSNCLCPCVRSHRARCGIAREALAKPKSETRALFRPRDGACRFLYTILSRDTWHRGLMLASILQGTQGPRP